MGKSEERGKTRLVKTSLKNFAGGFCFVKIETNFMMLY
jgi:hypothetical protein